MANFKIADYFIFKSVSPSSMELNNIIQFSYKSPNGVHDNKPLVLVHEKQGDRFYGINLNYDMGELNQAVTLIENKILPFIEEAYYKKYPDNKKKLLESKQIFSKSLVTEQEYREFMRKFPQKELELFEVTNKNMKVCRQYLYQRMSAVSKLNWKV